MNCCLAALWTAATEPTSLWQEIHSKKKSVSLAAHFAESYFQKSEACCRCRWLRQHAGWYERFVWFRLIVSAAAASEDKGIKYTSREGRSSVDDCRTRDLKKAESEKNDTLSNSAMRKEEKTTKPCGHVMNVKVFCCCYFTKGHLSCCTCRNVLSSLTTPGWAPAAAAAGLSAQRTVPALHHQALLTFR